MAKRNAVLLDSVRQVMVVFNENNEQNSAVLVALEMNKNKWKVALDPLSVGIGRKGFAAPGAKREGDLQSPSGFFRMKQLFCYDTDVNTRMPFVQTTSDDKWIDDPNSPDYNSHVRGTTRAGSYEKLKIRSDEYKYCMVIGYNMNPVVKGMGSAIFLHLSEGEQPNPSAGCVVVTRPDMEKLLVWMNPQSKLSILMGNKQVLMNGIR